MNDDLAKEIFEQMKMDIQLERMGELAKKADRDKNLHAKFGYIRQAYMQMMPDIMAMSKRDHTMMVHPYFFDWGSLFTPIEMDAWCSIRSKGVPLYPQFPVFNYFIDFANPYLKIGLELDGKQWHDEVKDKKRDEFLYSHGWRIYRIKGREAVAEFIAPYDLPDKVWNRDEWPEHIRHWMLNTADGVIAAINHVYFSERREAWEHEDLAYQTLNKHRLVNFEIDLDSEDDF